MRIARDNPVVGVGLGGFKEVYADRTGLRGDDPASAASHNTPVTVAAETGVPGLLLLVWLGAAALLATLRRVDASPFGRLALAAAAALTAIGVHSLFYNAFFEDPMTWGLLALAAVACGGAAGDRGSAVEPVLVESTRVRAPSPDGAVREPALAPKVDA
jgi:O-antigen ligase